MIFIGDSLIGGGEEMIAWATENFDDFCDFRPAPLYDVFAKEQYVKKIKESKVERENIFSKSTYLSIL